MRKSILKNLICSLALTVCAFGGAATVNTLFASADESSPVTSESVATVDFNDAVLTQESGAGIRYASSLSEMEESGLRYEIKMDADTYNGLKANYGVNVTFGVFIAPRDYHEHPIYTGRTYVNDVANITGESAIYGWKDGGLAADGETKRVVGGPIEILNIQTNHLTLKDDGYYHFYASITNVKLANYSREFVGFGYIKLKTAEYAITETGSGDATVYREIGAEYKFATATDNARSVAWVANKLLTTGKYKLPNPDGATAEEITEIETENATRREVLYAGYLKKSVMTVEFQSGQKIQIGQITNGEYAANTDSGMTMKYSYYNDSQMEETYYNELSGKTIYTDAAQSAAGVNGFVYNCGTTVLHYDVWNNVAGAYNSSRYAQVMVFNSQGMLIEGRDGINGKFVTKNAVIRANAKAADIHYVHSHTNGASDHIGAGDTSQELSATTARCFDIPVGGFAIIVARGTASETVSSNNMQYGAYVKIYYGTTLYDDKTLTEEYTDKAPLIYNTSSNAVIEVGENNVLKTATYIVKNGKTDDDIKTAVSDIKMIDDCGTFSKGDDVQGTVSSITTTATFGAGGGKKDVVFSFAGDGAQIETYTVKAVELTPTITVKLKDASGNYISNGSNNNGYTAANYFLNQVGGSANDFMACGFAIYTTDGAKLTNLATTTFNGYGVAIVFDRYGKINRTYNAAHDGTNCYYYDAENPNGVNIGSGKDSSYITTAFSSLKGGEYLIVAPNNGTNGAGSARQLFQNAVKAIGGQLIIDGVDFLQA